MGNPVRHSRLRIRGLPVQRGRMVSWMRNLSALRPDLIRRRNVDRSYIAELAADSEFGGNNFERAADGAAHVKKHRFSAAQYYHPIAINGNYTLIDRMVFSPLQAVYLDGPQHRMRPDNAAKDLLQEIQLIHDGFKVVRITDTEFMADPVGVIDRKINWLGAGNTFYDYASRKRKTTTTTTDEGLDPDRKTSTGIGLGDTPAPGDLERDGIDRNIKEAISQVQLDNGDISI